MRISACVLRKKLERDETVETSILGFVDDSHPAATELFDDAVMRDGLADHGRRSRFLARILGAPPRPSQLLCHLLEHRWPRIIASIRQQARSCILRLAHSNRRSYIPQQTNHLQVTIDKLYGCAIMVF